VLARKRHLEDALGARNRRDRRLPVEPQEARPRIEDAVPGRREARQELLRPLEPEAPVDDRQAEQVEPLGRR
jgi:hypothetical protein